MDTTAGPELRQDYGAKARQTLSELVHGKDVPPSSWVVTATVGQVGQVCVGTLYVNLYMV